ncbi:MAG: hypothetical protein ACKOF7_01505 [Phycisphaerales bacterium]
MRREPDPAVAAWIDRQPASSIWTTSITLFEVQFGLERMPRGRRREALRQAFELVVAEDLARRGDAWRRATAATSRGRNSSWSTHGRPGTERRSALSHATRCPATSRRRAGR